MAAATVQSSTNLFRRLAWNATVPIEIRLDGTVGAGAQVDRFYVSRAKAVGVRKVGTDEQRDVNGLERS